MGFRGRNCKIWGVFMYRKVNSEQLGIEEFFLPFGGKIAERQSMGKDGGNNALRFDRAYLPEKHEF